MRVLLVIVALIADGLAALLGMFISNTATALLMAPIAIASVLRISRCGRGCARAV
ncbi:MAG: hypothetical protein IPN53_14985 [Comamonadaceae bacterium]|nr:hypothetical protein [Comamonadaceae bacterium]